MQMIILRRSCLQPYPLDSWNHRSDGTLINEQLHLRHECFLDGELTLGCRLPGKTTPPALLRDGEGRGTALTRTLVVDPAVGDGVLHVAARAASCDADGGQGAACHMHQQDWGIPVRVAAAGTSRIDLPLLVSWLPE